VWRRKLDDGFSPRDFGAQWQKFRGVLWENLRGFRVVLLVKGKLGNFRRFKTNTKGFLRV